MFFTQCGTLYYTSVQSKVNPAYITNYSFKVYNDSQGISRFNATGTIVKELSRILLFYELKGKPYDPRLGEYTICKSKMDVCKAATGVIGAIVAEQMMEIMQDYSNYTFSCPQKKGTYHTHEFPIVDTSVIPKLFIGKPGSWDFSVVAKAKVPKMRGWVEFLAAKIFGCVG